MTTRLTHAILVATSGALLLLASRAGAEPPRPQESAAATGPQCREQKAQDFLLRKGQIAKIGATRDEHRVIEAARKRANHYRTRQ